jgi:hypothetical protein
MFFSLFGLPSDGKAFKQKKMNADEFQDKVCRHTFAARVRVFFFRNRCFPYQPEPTAME